MAMKLDRFALYDVTRAEPVQNNTAEEMAKARSYVAHSISDEDERHEILQALGLEPPDFVWDTAPGRRGRKERVKKTLDGDSYPLDTGVKNGKSDTAVVPATAPNPRTGDTNASSL